MRPGRTLLALAAVAALLVLLLLGGYTLSRRPIENYPEPDGPVFSGNFAGSPGVFDGMLRIVAWNLQFGREVEEAIRILEGTPDLQDADILLLQEMDAEGVEEIARRLGYNYVYYPAVIHPEHGKTFGNAILSKWPIQNPAKIILPNWLMSWYQSRNAARAFVAVGETEILVYSVHLDTIWMIPGTDRSQGEYLVEEINAQSDFMIVGGDFNTWSPGSIALLERGFGRAGLERISRGSGYTFEAAGIQLVLDHIFTSKDQDFEAGVYRGTDASDHYPLWAEIEILNE